MHLTPPFFLQGAVPNGTCKLVAFLTGASSVLLDIQPLSVCRLLRTIYFPAMRAGLGRYWSLVLVFFVSAVAHEVMVGVPLHMVKFWSFAGIMLQVKCNHMVLAAALG